LAAIGNTLQWIGEQAHKLLVMIQGVFDDSVDVAARLEEIAAEGAAGREARIAAVADASIDRDRERMHADQARKQRKKDREGALGAAIIGAGKDQADAEARFDALKADAAAARAAADLKAANRPDRAKPKDFKPFEFDAPDADELADRFKALKMPDFDEIIGRSQKAAAGEARGTFNAAAILGLQSGGKDWEQETAKNTAAQLDRLRRIEKLLELGNNFA
jgi:hypothetical protein